MGLDITAFRKLTKLGDDEYRDGTVMIYNDDFPGREEGLDIGIVYVAENSKYVFGMGYGSYNKWREQLAALAGHNAEYYFKGNTGPFAELICFSDCEGIIGPVVAARLAANFAEYDKVAKRLDEWFYKHYHSLHEGLKIAADGGALKFS